MYDTDPNSYVIVLDGFILNIEDGDINAYTLNPGESVWPLPIGPYLGTFPTIGDHWDGTEQGWNPPPSEYNDYNESTHVWDLNQGRFTPAFKDNLSHYRDSQIAQPVTYTREDSSAFFTISPDTRTFDALTRLVAYLLLTNPEGTIDFKTSDGFKAMTAEDIQALFVVAELREQLCFSAEKAVLEIEDVTPYSDITFSAGHADFDTYITNNS